MFILIENGDVYGPEPLGRVSVLLTSSAILKIGEVDVPALEKLGLPVDVIDASGCIVTPGFIDPHQHLLGGSGEQGFSSQTPEISASEIIAAGITTVVGCLGVDTTMKTMAGLLARAKVLKEEGLSAFIWSGGYNVPPTTITNSIRDFRRALDRSNRTGTRSSRQRRLRRRHAKQESRRHTLSRRRN